MLTIEQRIISLEKSNTRYRIILGIIMATLTLSIISSFSPRKQSITELVQAKKFELLSDSGTVLARFEDYKGSGAISTFNHEGKRLTDIVPTKGGGAAVVLYDGKGNKNLALTDVDGGGGSIVLYNTAGKTIVTLARTSKNAGSIALSNGDKNIVMLAGDNGNAGAVLTYNENGIETARLPSGKK